LQEISNGPDPTHAIEPYVHAAEDLGVTGFGVERVQRPSRSDARRLVGVAGDGPDLRLDPSALPRRIKQRFMRARVEQRHAIRLEA
jgi:hypothetical protein